MKKKDFKFLFACLLCALLGAALPFWPLALASLALAALYLPLFIPLLLGMFFDLYFGAPLGPLAFIHFPFFFCALAGIGLRVMAVRHILESRDLGRI